MASNKITHKIQKDVIEQKDSRFSKYKSIDDALKNKEFEDIDPATILIVLSKSGQLYELNVISSIIWEGLKNKKTKDEILNDILGNFEVEKDVAMKDMSLFLEALNKKGMII